MPFCFVKITKRGWIIWSKEKIKTCGVLCWLVVKLYRGLNLHLYEYPLELTLLWWDKVATLSAMCMIEYNIKKSYSSCLKFQVWNGCDWLEVKHKKVEFALVWIAIANTLKTVIKQCQNLSSYVHCWKQKGKIRCFRVRTMGHLSKWSLDKHLWPSKMSSVC